MQDKIKITFYGIMFKNCMDLQHDITYHVQCGFYEKSLSEKLTRNWTTRDIHKYSAFWDYLLGIL